MFLHQLLQNSIGRRGLCCSEMAGEGSARLCPEISELTPACAHSSGMAHASRQISWLKQGNKGTEICSPEHLQSLPSSGRKQVIVCFDRERESEHIHVFMCALILCNKPKYLKIFFCESSFHADGYPGLKAALWSIKLVWNAQKSISKEMPLSDLSWSSLEKTNSQGSSLFELTQISLDEESCIHGHLSKIVRDKCLTS